MRAILLATSITLTACQMTPQQADALSNMGAAIMSSGQPYGAYSPSYRPVAMLKGSTVSGFNRICYYDRLGSTEAMNIPSTGICPLQIP